MGAKELTYVQSASFMVYQNRFQWAIRNEVLALKLDGIARRFLRSPYTYTAAVLTNNLDKLTINLTSSGLVHVVSLTGKWVCQVCCAPDASLSLSLSLSLFPYATELIAHVDCLPKLNRQLLVVVQFTRPKHSGGIPFPNAVQRIVFN